MISPGSQRCYPERTGNIAAAMIRLASAGILLWAGSLIAAETPGKLELMVVDSATRLPVSGAVVELQRISKGPASIRHATTDQYGRAAFRQVDPGEHRAVFVEMEGYGYEWSGATFEVAAGAAATGVVTVFRLGVIEGTVTDDMEHPIANANVTALKYSYQDGTETLLSSGAAFGVKTDTQGRYRIDRLQPGVYFVRVASERGLFPAVYYPNGTSPAEAVHVTFSPGTTNLRADLRVRPADPFHIRGKVSGIPGNTQAGVVNIESCTEGVREFGAYTNALRVSPDGTFDLADVPRGRYCLNASFLSGKETVAYAHDIVRITDKDVDRITLHAAPMFGMSGRVTLEAGKSLAMPAAVRLRSTEGLGKVPISGKVDPETGAFRTNVWPAPYRVQVESSPGEYVRAIRFVGREVTDGVIDAAGAGILEIDMAAAQGVLHGKVKDAAGIVTITLMREGSLSETEDQFRMVSVVDNDRFTLRNLPPGRYKVYAWQNYRPDLVRSPEFLRSFPAATVDVLDNQQSEVEVRLISAAEIIAGADRF